MGLAIHYRLEAPSTQTEHQIRATLTRLWQIAATLPVQSQTDLVTLSARQIRSASQPLADSPWSWPCVQAQRRRAYRFDDQGWPQIVPDRASKPGDQMLFIHPTRLIGFSITPGDGCEAMNCFIATYPTTVRVADHFGRERLLHLDPFTRPSDTAFCTTRYACRAEYGGIANFLIAHLRVIAILDTARDLGFQVTAADDAGYWETRDISALISVIGSHDATFTKVEDVLKTLVATAGDPPPHQAAPTNVAVVLDLIQKTRGIVSR